MYYGMDIHDLIKGISCVPYQVSIHRFRKFYDVLGGFVWNSVLEIFDTYRQKREFMHLSIYIGTQHSDTLGKKNRGVTDGIRE